jgi:xanthine/CO dehydrogenase XdhC/CoxF family maturation factor
MLSPNELRSILQAYDEACSATISSALATVVHVQGSSYRRPGARMLVRDDAGSLVASVAGASKKTSFANAGTQ